MAGGVGLRRRETPAESADESLAHKIAELERLVAEGDS
ncbi:hypothetical protein NRB56_46650 [Nocardia sp. RB56]|uniref:Uncharacterized protein n=1 Tax=Nocardia aurantia TaxID=2585199 RepID=A0A7K0DTK6_9NOCA|nr:hypothetical protein [Nocardia aurantia]